MELEGKERVRQLAKEFFQQSSDLDRAFGAHVDLGVALVKCFGKGVEPPDIAILSEDAFDGHIF